MTSSWQERIYEHARAPYHADLRLAIDLLTKAFEANLGLTPQMGKEWEFIITADNPEKLNEENLNLLIKAINMKIEAQNAGLLKLGKGSGYERFYVDNGFLLSRGDAKTPVMEITTQTTNPLHSAILIDLFQRMLEKELEKYGFKKEIIIVGKEKNVICGMHDNISFVGDGGKHLPEGSSGAWFDVMQGVCAARRQP